MPDIKRIEREMRQCAKDVDSGIKLSTVGDSLLHLKGCFNGPPDTPYQGGTFMVDIKIPDGYPFSPPLMKFDTLIYHPNISSQVHGNNVDWRHLPGYPQGPMDARINNENSTHIAGISFIRRRAE